MSFEVDALRLEDDADMAAQCSGLADGVEAGDRGAAGSRDHERGKNTEQSSLAAAVRAEQTEEFGRLNVERNAVQRGAVLIAVDEIANGDDWLRPRLQQGGVKGESRAVEFEVTTHSTTGVAAGSLALT